MMAGQNLGGRGQLNRARVRRRNRVCANDGANYAISHRAYPSPIVDALFGGWMAGLLKGSVDLNVYGAILKGARNVAAIATAISAPERTTRMLCDALVGTGYLTKDEQGEYGVPPFAEAFLDPGEAKLFGVDGQHFC